MTNVQDPSNHKAQLMNIQHKAVDVTDLSQAGNEFTASLTQSPKNGTGPDEPVPPFAPHAEVPPLLPLRGSTGSEKRPGTLVLSEVSVTRDMRSREVERSSAGGAGDGLGLMRDFWLYVWLRRVSVAAAHLASLGLVVLIFVLSRPGTSLFSWHPVCMSLGFGLMMTEGILLFSAEGSVFCFRSRQWKLRTHWLLQALLLLCGATGLGFMVASKNLSELPHFTSWHSLLGAATMALTALQSVGGLLLLLPCGHALPRPRLYHATCGLVAYLLATFSLLSAMFSEWFQAVVMGRAWYVVLLLPLCPALVVMNQITSAFLPKKKISS